MKCYKHPFNSFCIKTGKHILCKMKACSRTRGTSGISCVNILVTFAVFFCIFTTDIWWQRNMTISFKPVFINCKIKLERAEFCTGITFMFNNLCNSSIRKLIMHAGLLFFGRFYHCIPDAAFLVDCIQKHKLSFASGSFFYSINTRTTNTGIIKNHKGSRFNQIRKIIHHVMFHFSCHAVQKHKLILSAHSAWMLGNKLLW